MKQFKVHTGSIANTFPATMEDMGLCYVTKFIVDGQEIHSVSPRDVTVEDRIKNDDNALEEYGYYIIAGSVE